LCCPSWQNKSRHYTVTSDVIEKSLCKQQGHCAPQRRAEASSEFNIRQPLFHACSINRAVQMRTVLKSNMSGEPPANFSRKNYSTTVACNSQAPVLSAKVSFKKWLSGFDLSSLLPASLRALSS
jgi:hypothetical protein